MTRYAISDNHCKNIARYGYFDPFVDQQEDSTRKRDRKTHTSTGLNKGGIYNG